jgi:ABC-type multidrug transport system fused ATPase/permease subunit
MPGQADSWQASRITLGGWTLLARHFAPRRRALGRVAAWTMVESLPALGSGLLVGKALDNGFLDGRPGVGLGLLGLLGATLAVRALATRQLYPWLGEVIEPLRDGLVADVVTAAIGRGAASDERTDAADVARLTQQIEAVRQLVSALLRSFRQFGMSILASLFGIAALAPQVGLIVIPMVLVALGVYVVSLRSLAARQRAVVLAGEQVAQVAEPLMSGLRDVIACGAEMHAQATVGTAIGDQAEAELALAKTGAVRTLVVAIGAQAPVLVVLAATPWLIARQQLSVGQITGAIVYLTASLEPALRSLVHVAGGWGLQLAVTVQRLAEACAAPALPAPVPGLAPPSTDLHIDDLTFAYSPTAAPVIDRLTVSLPAGDHLAVVGPSGIGKSTLANLLARLLTPQHGQIRLGGVPVDHIDETWLRRSVALIPQQAYIFAGTLRDNLAWLSPGVTDARLETAATAVGFGSVIDRLGGLGTIIGPEGVTLSEGERQLLALARVWACPATIVILDEATCYLDPAAEAHAEQAFAVRANTTLIVVAHRISSALRARRILVMDGATSLLGTHRTLLARSCLYASLVGHWQAKTLPSDATADLGTSELLSPRGVQPATVRGRGHGARGY